MFFVNISEKENIIELKFKKCPSLDTIKQIIRKKMQLEIDEYNLMIADDVIMSDQHLVTIFDREKNQCHLNIIKHAALVHQAMPIAGDEINPSMHVASDVLVYHREEEAQPQLKGFEVHSQGNSVDANLEHNDEDVKAQEKFFQPEELPVEALIYHHDTDALQQRPDQENSSVLKKEVVGTLEEVKTSDNTDVVVPERNHSAMMSFLIHLWQWITSFFMQLLGKIEAEPAQSSSMSLR